MQHCCQESAKVIDTTFVHAENGLLDDTGLHRAVQSHQGHDGSPPGAQVFVHGQVVHLHQRTNIAQMLTCQSAVQGLLHTVCTQMRETAGYEKQVTLANV